MPEWLPEAVRYAEQWLGYQMRSTEQPGCVLAVAHRGKLVAEHAFGVADLATGTPLTPAHRFRVASHSKTFASAAIMRLHEAGRLHLDDPIGTHVGDLAPEVAAVTISQLLSHTAGLLRDGVRAVHWQDRQPFLDETALRAELAEPLIVPANSRQKYSNVGFGLVGLAIEAITGEDFGTWIAREIVVPSGLDATTPDMPVPAGTPLATGHSGKLPVGRRFAIPGHNPTHALASATGFVSTAGDLARFIGSLDPEAGTSVLSAASRREMTRRHWRVPDDSGGRHYGLGTIGGTLEGHEWFGHSGAFQGFISRTACVPEWGVAVSIVTNCIDGLANPWVEGVLGIFHHFALHGAASPTVADWTGRWWSYWGAFDLVPMGNQVFVTMPALMQPFTDASVLDITSPTEGRVARANGFGAHGEPARRIMDADGAATLLMLGGAELLPEQALLTELEARASDPAPATQP
ncbi:serine hydrolase domain-containing protein [Lichenifustis flavocetrariae]|uniref:Beta-lactamase family protein n=1 Tax=Lichenifustis flavocetrariae TaxID=2949735 RepID=A0AA41Z3T1_9HYPH|nr:serine hydrolase domain-containing protein [Lichenifustis flavocetrariae]MCW6508742.1 beta-lactamase family protein [Lichenifustis flavocetrariae]